jgi:hypothetical protein
MPIVWFDDEARIFPEIHSELSTLIIALNIAYYVKFIVPSISILFIFIISSYIFIRVRFNERDFYMNDYCFLVAAYST